MGKGILLFLTNSTIFSGESSGYFNISLEFIPMKEIDLEDNH